MSAINNWAPDQHIRSYILGLWILCWTTWGFESKSLRSPIKVEGWINVHVASCPLQFVPFRDYMDRTGNHVLSMARLAKDVLAEIPDQLISYMKSRGIKPNPSPPPYTPPGHTHNTQIWAHIPKPAFNTTAPLPGIMG